MMDAFSYLSVLISIILGLAITQVLQGYRALLLARGRTQIEATPLIWSGLVLLFAAQAWWASFGLNARHDWDFLGFAVILVQMGLIYMLSALVLPDVAPGEKIHLGDHFRTHRRAFFAFLLAMLVASICKEAILADRLPLPINLAFHFAFGLGSVAGMVLSGRRAQLALALIASVGFLSYVALLFGRL
ncbi:MAG TPA: hypothetical protein VFG41_00535 [Sphingomicrobium sp.]|jgi:hypothetical protein|nr:hypothetical protein [Sphingomicrobium sp.]